VTHLNLSAALHSRAVWTAIATAIVAVAVAMGVPLTVSQQHVLIAAIVTMALTIYGSLRVAATHAKAAGDAVNAAANSQATVAAMHSLADRLPRAEGNSPPEGPVPHDQ